MVNKALIFPFVCTATDLPREGILPPPVSGARFDFTAEMSNLGATGITVANYSETDTTPFTFTTTGNPLTIEESNRRFWRFPGNGAANVSGNVNPTVQTRFMRVRLRETLTEGKVLLGNSIAGGQLMSANADRFFIHGGTQLNGPAIPPGTGWHTIIGVFNGANSVISVDGVEVKGNAGTATANGFRVAASGSAVYVQMDVARVGLIPGALDLKGRNVLRRILEF